MSVPIIVLIAALPVSTLPVRGADEMGQSDAVAPPAGIPSNPAKPSDAAVHDYWPGHGDGQRMLPEPRRVLPRRSISRDNPTASIVLKLSHQCDFKALVSKQGEALLAHIRNMHFDCISELFNQVPAPTRFRAFQESRMLTVSNAALSDVIAYDGANGTDALVKLLYYLQAGHFVQFNNPDEDDLRWAPVINAKKVEVIEAFLANAHRDDENNETGAIAQVIFALMDAPALRLRYVDSVADWLSRWSRERAESYNQGNAALAALTLLFACHSEPGFKALVRNDATVPNVLLDLVLSDWMVGTAAEWLLRDAARELARFLGFSDIPIYDEVRAAVARVLARYEPFGRGAAAWVATVSAALYYLDCSDIGVCQQIEEVKNSVLSVEHSCNERVVIRGQDLNDQQLAESCAALRRLDDTFHWLLKTNRQQPVADDVTARYESVAFADYDNYATYSPLLFGNSTNNGGIYFEGDPSQPGNVSRHLGYVATWLQGKPIWNIEHEYVHHLDGRYNMYGSFQSYRVSTHKTVWWIEGLAEYLSLREDNQSAIAVVSPDALALDKIFETTYDDGVVLVYRWGYLAVRFMFERKPTEINQLLGLLRAGNYDGYLDYIDAGMGTRNENAWRGWLPNVKATQHANVDALPTLLARELSTFDDETRRVAVDIGTLLGNGRALAVNAVSTNPAVARVSTDGDRLIVVAVAAGRVTIIVDVSDRWGTTKRRFELIVTNECPRWLCPSFASGWRLAVLAPAQDQPSD